jgi:hypothetical protein
MLLNCHKFTIIYEKHTILRTMNTSETSTCCSNLLCNSSLHEQLPAALLDAQLDQTVLFYAATDVLLDGGTTRTETCSSVVCFLNIWLWICDNLSAFVGWYWNNVSTLFSYLFIFNPTGRFSKASTRKKMATCLPPPHCSHMPNRTIIH